MRMTIALASVFVSATAFLAPSINSPAAARDLEPGISELSARGGARARAVHAGPRAGVRAGGVRAGGVGAVRAGTVAAPTTTVVAPSTVGVGVRAGGVRAVRHRR
jgi:hypothetical protein